MFITKSQFGLVKRHIKLAKMTLLRLITLAVIVYLQIIRKSKQPDKRPPPSLNSRLQLDSCYRYSLLDTLKRKVPLTIECPLACEELIIFNTFILTQSYIKFISIKQKLKIEKIISNSTKYKILVLFLNLLQWKKKIIKI